MIVLAKCIVRKILALTPMGRAYYERRKDCQRKKALREVQEFGPEIFQKVNEICESLSVPYIISDGTLLGCIRDGGIMPHDDDVDFSILPCELNLAGFVASLEGAGFKFFWKWTYEGVVTEFAMTYKGVHVDFYLLEEKHGNFVSHWYTPLDGVKYPSKDMWSAIESSKPIMRDREPYVVPRYNVIVMIPKNWEEYLTLVYGSWRVPDKNFRATALGDVSGLRKLLPGYGHVSYSRIKG